MASVSITVRRKNGVTRYIPRWRNGGRGYPVQHGGSFRTLKEARIRANLIAGELAAGRNPADLLQTFKQDAAPRQVVTLSAWFDRFIESRIDVGKSAISLYGNARDKLGRLADHDPATLKASDIQGWIADNSKLSPKTVRHYLSSLRQVVDFAEVEPNPARSPRVKVPALKREELVPPSREEFDALLDKLAAKMVLPVKLMECCGLRVGEVCHMMFGDVDFADGRLRISRARTKGGTAGQRWLPVPDVLTGELDALVPLEDRAAAKHVFNLTAATVRDSIARACKLAGIAHYHPHDLRHRRISLWVAHGMDAVTVKTWAGHSNASMSLDTYSHVVIDHANDPWKKFWVVAYTGARVARVWPRENDPA